MCATLGPETDVVGLLLLAALAAPADDQRAREVYENGSTLYAEGLYEDAIAAFQESYRLAGVHELLLNIANCYERLQRYEDAIAVLNRYRAYAKPEERAQLKARIEAIRVRMEGAKGYVKKGVDPLPIPPLQAPEVPKTPVPSD